MWPKILIQCTPQYYKHLFISQTHSITSPFTPPRQANSDTLFFIIHRIKHALTERDPKTLTTHIIRASLVVSSGGWRWWFSFRMRAKWITRRPKWGGGTNRGWSLRGGGIICLPPKGVFTRDLATFRKGFCCDLNWMGCWRSKFVPLLWSSLRIWK